MSIPEHPHPLATFKIWYDEAGRSESGLPEAMALATVGPAGTPSVRMVLLKGADERGFVFYTNMESRKAQDLSANPQAALCLYWKSLRKQVRIEGAVEQVGDDEADDYFECRPRDAQIGAWASKQSRVLTSAGELDRDVAEHESAFFSTEVPRPNFWSGYRVVPERIEFWEERPNRLHERLVYVNANGAWSTHRLYP